MHVDCYFLANREVPPSESLDYQFARISFTKTLPLGDLCFKSIEE